MLSEANKSNAPLAQTGASTGWLLAGYTGVNLGHGLAWPFLAVFLHSGRGLTLAQVGMVFGAVSAAGIAAIAVSGWLVDRLGGTGTLRLALVLNAVGAGGMALASNFGGILVLAMACGAGTAAMWNALVSILAGLVPENRRAGLFAASFVLQNIGSGLGAVLGGLIIRLVPGSAPYGPLLLSYAGSLFLFALLAPAGRKGRIHSYREPPEPALFSKRSRIAAGYMAPLKDRALLGTSLLNALFGTVTAAHLDVIFPTWVAGPARAGSHIIGAAFFAHALTVVLAQFPALRYALRNSRRTRAAACASLLSSLSLILVFVAGNCRSAWLKGPGLVAALAVMGLGAVFYQPGAYALVSLLAPDCMRGRYNAVFNLAWQAGSLIGPMVTGIALTRRGFGFVFIGLAAFSAFVALAAVWIERLIPADANWAGGDA